MRPLLALLVLLWRTDAVGAVQTANVPDTVRFTPTGGHRTFAVREPVLSIQPRTVLITNTLFGTFFSEGGAASRPTWIRILPSTMYSPVHRWMAPRLLRARTRHATTGQATARGAPG